APALIARAGFVPLTGGCEGSSASSGTRGSSGTAVATSSPSALAFSRCMRSHGVTSFPDPNSSGEIPKNEVVPLASSPQFRVAQGLCQHLLPNTSVPTSTHAQVEAAL